MEAIIGGVSETIIQLKAQPYRKELGFEDAGFETGLKNVLMVAGASAVLSPALMGVFKAFGKGIDTGKKLLSKTSVEDLKKINKEVGEKLNSKYKDKVLNDIEIPKKDNPFPDNEVGRIEHNERLDTAVKQINNGDEVDLPPIKNEIIKENLPPAAKLEFNDMTSSNPTIKNTYNQIDNIKNKIKLPDKAVDNTILPRELKGAKPKYNYGNRSIELEFDNDIANALYIVGGKGKSASHEAYISFLKKAGVKDIPKKSQAIRDTIRSQAKGGSDIVKVSAEIPKKINETIIPEKITQVETVTKKFNQNPSKLADDQSNVKDFDVPNEAAYRNQASDLEGSMFDVSTSSAIKTEAGTGAAAKTSPRVELDNFQDLSLASQKTDATPSSSVLATATTNPPLVRGSIINKVGDTSTISNKLIYQVSNDFNEIFNTLSKKLKNVKKELQPIAIKYNGDLKARVKKKPQLQKKLDDGLNAESISDYLGARISVKTIHEAEMVLNDLSKIYKFIERDNFLTDAGRVGSDYRAIHAQALTKDGFTFEIQIRLKELDPLTEQSHILFKLKKGGVKNTTMVGWNKLLNAEKVINKKLKAKYFEIKDKEFTRLKSEDPLDRKIPIGHRIDEVTGEKVPLTITAREALEQAAKDETMLSRLKDCV